MQYSHVVGTAETDTEDITYKDVVIVGNGPSGIILSYILSGNWPYYTGKEHPDDMLNTRLRSIDLEKSLLEQDLSFLSQDLEGRSRNPVAVLVDKLNHPTDDRNSSSLLQWKPNPAAKTVDHIVLGKFEPGGCWQQINKNITTISLSSWMELPEFSFEDWENKWYNLRCRCQNNRPPTRLKTKQVAAYYRDYVKQMKLTKNFRNYSIVHSIERAKNTKKHPSIGQHDRALEDDLLWEVTGYDSCKKKNFKYLCRKLVLASGTCDDHKKLNIPGELNYPEWVFHELKRFENAVIELKKRHNVKDSLDPVMVIGSGLSAADAVLIANRFGLSVLHVFKSYKFLSDHKFSKNVHPEYYQVYSWMKNGELSTEYKALAQHEVIEINQSDCEKRVRVKLADGSEILYRVSMVSVMIGYQPVLNFLPEEFHCGKTLGIKKGQPIDGQKNPIGISPWSYELLHGPRNVYAMGPLVGDNVVRVIPGGAIAVASHIYQEEIK